MSETLVKIAQYLPTVREPEKEQSLKQMLTWTGIILLIYFFLASIPIYGGEDQAVEQALEQLQTFQTLVGAEIGTIVTLGIIPIVTASIILQMMVGSEILPWDTNTQEGKIKFQSTQKLLAYTLCLVMAIGYVFSGTFGNLTGTPALFALVTLQIAMGGWLIVLMDDLVQKWGFGSGVGLFIAAGVSRQIFVSLISPLTSGGEPYWIVEGEPAGAIISFATTLEASALLPIVSTISIFALVVYLQSMRVEVPLTFGNVRGFGQKWPLKFLYTSVMPVIFVAALIANFQIAGRALAGEEGCSILGCFADGEASSGIVYFMQPPTDVITNIVTAGLTAISVPVDILHILFYVGIYTGGAIMFSIFWARTAGMGSDKVAQQISQTGMKVPGFRKDTRVIQKVLDRYIPGLTVLSGATVGFIAAVADLTQAAGGGMGILLAVMILYRMYEQLAQKHMEELHPALKDFFQ